MGDAGIVKVGHIDRPIWPDRAMDWAKPLIVGSKRVLFFRGCKGAAAGFHPEGMNFVSE